MYSWLEIMQTILDKLYLSTLSSDLILQAERYSHMIFSKLPVELLSPTVLFLYKLLHEPALNYHLKLC